MRIIFIGCVESSYIMLEELLKYNSDVVGVIAKEKSSFNSDFKDLGVLCKKYNIEINYVKSINDEESIQFIHHCKPDLGLCIGWSQLVSNEVITMFPKGMVGYHPAQLPNNRGRHPIIWALALGLNQTASTFFMLEEGADEGAVISQEIVNISYEDNARSLYDKLMEKAKVQIVDLVKTMENNKIQAIPQSREQGNVWRKRSKNDGCIDWRMSSRSIYNLVRSLSEPYVGAHCSYKGKEYKIWSVKEKKISGLENFEPGKVIEIFSNTHYLVKAGEHCIEVLNSDPIILDVGDYL